MLSASLPVHGRITVAVQTNTGNENRDLEQASVNRIGNENIHLRGEKCRRFSTNFLNVALVAASCVSLAFQFLDGLSTIKSDYQKNIDFDSKIQGKNINNFNFDHSGFLTINSQLYKLKLTTIIVGTFAMLVYNSACFTLLRMHNRTHSSPSLPMNVRKLHFFVGALTVTYGFAMSIIFPPFNIAAGILTAYGSIVLLNAFPRERLASSCEKTLNGLRGLSNRVSLCFQRCL